MKTGDIKRTKINNASASIGKYLALVLGTLGGSAALAPVTAHADVDLLIGNHDMTTGGTIAEYTLTGAAAGSPSFPFSAYEPGGIAVSGSDMYFTTGYFGSPGQIQKYTLSGSAVTTPLVTGLNSPAGIAITGSGNYLYVANRGGNTIGEYNTSGTLENTISTGISSPVGLAIYGNNLFVANSGNSSIAKYSLSGTPEGSFSTSSTGAPYGIALSSNGSYLYVASDSGTVSEYTTAGTLVNSFGSSGSFSLLSAYGVALYGGDLFVTQDQNYNDVGVFNAATGATLGSETLSGGTLTNPLISGLDDPYSIAITPEPGPLALLGMGALGLLLKRRKTHN